MRCDPKLRVVVGKDGGYVNQLVIRPNHLESFFEQRKKRKTPRYFRQIPSLLALQEKLKKCEPPPEAPRHFTTKPEDRSFSSALFNHVFSSNIKDDGVVCLSMNQQIHQKRVLTVYYKPSPHTKSEHSPRKNSSDPIKPVRCASNVWTTEYIFTHTGRNQPHNFSFFTKKRLNSHKRSENFLVILQLNSGVKVKGWFKFVYIFFMNFKLCLLSFLFNFATLGYLTNTSFSLCRRFDVYIFKRNKKFMHNTNCLFQTRWSFAVPPYFLYIRSRFGKTFMKDINIF